MSAYSIQYIEQLTGIKAHTVRIWEQRYKIVSPLRSKGNVRSYTSEHLKKLLNITTLLNAGFRIGDLSRLSKKALQEKIDDLYQHALPPGAIEEAYVNSMIAAAMTFDEALFNKTYAACLTKLGPAHMYLRVIHPALVRIGTLWNIDKMNPAQEHFISNLVRQKLLASVNDLRAPHHKESWVLFLPNSESHETGLLFVHYMLRSFGYKTVYLGPHVEIDMLKDTLKNVTAKGFLYFYVTHVPQEEIMAFTEQMDTAFPNHNQVICGPASLLSCVKPKKNLVRLNTPNDFVQWIENFKHA